MEVAKMVLFVGIFIFLVIKSFRMLFLLLLKILKTKSCLSVIKIIILVLANIGGIVASGNILTYMVAEVPHTTKLNYNDNIFIDVKYSIFDIYYTTDGSSIKSNGILYTQKIPISTLGVDNKNNIITLAYQVKILDLFFIGYVQERQYEIINIPDMTYIKFDIVNDYPIILKDEVYKNVSFQDVCVSNSYFLFDKESQTVKNLIDGDLNTQSRFFSSDNYIIQFCESNNKEFQKIYIRGGIYIDKVLIYINEDVYWCEFPIVENLDSVVVLNLQKAVVTDNLFIQFYSKNIFYDIGDIWIDNYIY